MEFIDFKGHSYLKLQSEGNAARWIMPLAQYYCKGVGLDIGASKREWAMPNAMCIDPSLNEWDAMNIPVEQQDYIFSSHCLEHIKENWMNVLDYWLTKIKDGGILFLYLPHSSQEYWKPENNRKHVHSFSGDEIRDYLRRLGYDPYLTPVDYNNSFAVICEKWKVDPYAKEKQACLEAEKYYADKVEQYCIDNEIAYIREANNVIYNEPSPTIKKGEPVQADYFGDCIWYNGERFAK